MHIVAELPHALAAADRGPAPGLSLADCSAAGCVHPECAAAAARLVRLVPAHGATRRLQALAYMGWDADELAARLAVDVLALLDLVDGTTTEVPAALATAARVLYESLWSVAGPSEVAAADAWRRRWAAPLAWDDHPGPYWIDGPDAEPSPLWRPARRPRLAGRARPAACSAARRLAAALAAAVTGGAR